MIFYYISCLLNVNNPYHLYCVNIVDAENETKKEIMKQKVRPINRFRFFVNSFYVKFMYKDKLKNRRG